MNNSVIRKVTEIRMDEYVTWNWIDITTQGDQETTLLRGRIRTPSEAYQAANEFEVFVKYLQHALKVPA